MLGHSRAWWEGSPPVCETCQSGSSVSATAIARRLRAMAAATTSGTTRRSERHKSLRRARGREAAQGQRTDAANVRVQLTVVAGATASGSSGVVLHCDGDEVSVRGCGDEKSGRDRVRRRCCCRFWRSEASSRAKDRERVGWKFAPHSGTSSVRLA